MVYASNSSTCPTGTSSKSRSGIYLLPRWSTDGANVSAKADFLAASFAAKSPLTNTYCLSNVYGLFHE